MFECAREMREERECVRVRERDRKETHRVLLVGVVGHPATERAREDVGETEAPANERAFLLVHGVGLREVERDLAVDHQLEPEGEHVHDEEDPDAPVGRGDLQRAPRDRRGLGGRVAACEGARVRERERAYEREST